MSRSKEFPDLEAIEEWSPRIAEAARAFECRWTRAALQRVNPDLSGRLHQQVNLWAESCVNSMAETIHLHGAATVRGWQAAVRCMEDMGAKDDAYMLGECSETGLRIAIGSQKAAIDRLQELYGGRVAHITPDEVATLLGKHQLGRDVAEVKRVFPGATMTGSWHQ